MSSTIIPKTTQDIATDHVEAHPTSTTRRPIFAGYQNYSSDFSERISDTWTQWIGGSFVTDKNDPEDIDLINLIPGDLVESEDRAKALRPFLNKYGSKERYLVHGQLALLFPEGHQHRPATLERIEYWLKWFGSDRNGVDKDIVQNEYPQPEAANEEA
jgi:hypothetical protein